MLMLPTVAEPGPGTRKYRGDPASDHDDLLSPLELMLITERTQKVSFCLILAYPAF
jgi:hypothetical protein